MKNVEKKNHKICRKIIKKFEKLKKSIKNKKNHQKC